MKGLSIPIALLLLLIMLIAIIIPAFLIFNALNSYSSQGSIQGSIYQQQQEYQNQQVFRGNPNIYYNSSPSMPTLDFVFTSIPTPFNITQIYYFDNNWIPILKQSIVIGGNTKLPLPQQTYGKPIIIVTSLGNIYFLNPNTSVVTVFVNQGTGKIPVYITAFVINGSKLLPAQILVQLISSSEVLQGLTPQLFDVQPGNYLLNDFNGSPIYLSNYGLTAKFLNWSLIGYGTLTHPNYLETSFNVYGPLVITAIYNASLEKFEVTIKPNNLPLGTSISQGPLKLTSVNTTVPVYIDNKLYYIGPNGITLNLTYGYHIIQFPAQYNITFNYKYGSFNVPYGEIETYSFSGFTTNTNKITIVSSDEIFVNGSGTVYANYEPIQTYYLVEVKNNFILPPGCSLDYNTSPVLGDIAGQLLQINYTYDWGPSKNYEPQKFYVKAGSIYNVTYDYIVSLPVGNYTVNGCNYTSLLSYPWYICVTNSSGVFSWQLDGNTEPNIYFYINSPTIIVNGEMYLYGGKMHKHGGV